MFKDFVEEINGAKGIRNQILVCHIYLEYFLTKCLEKKKETKPRLDIRPWMSFSQKLKLAYASGIINEIEYDDLKKMNNIRNEIAHKPMISYAKIMELINGISLIELPENEKVELRIMMNELKRYPDIFEFANELGGSAATPYFVFTTHFLIKLEERL